MEKNINLLLIDGEATKRIKCTMENWSGIIYKIPRSDIYNCKNIEELKESGVYILLGIDKNKGKYISYIGQARIRKNGEGILNRVIEHKLDLEKDYWNEVIVLINNSCFSTEEINYLEYRFLELVKNANIYIVKNLNRPTEIKINKIKKEELERYISNSKEIIRVLGYRIFELLVLEEIENSSNREGLELYLKRKIERSGNEIHAKCIKTKEGFLLLKGSEIEITETKTLANIIKKDRKKAKIDRVGILLEDIFYKSPSRAGSFVIGGKVNGLKEWKTKEGISLGEYEKNI